MKRLLIIEIILLFLFCNISFTTLSDENNGSLSGYITDEEMNPISGANVKIECGDYYFECYSNDIGFFYQDNIPIVDCYWMVTVTKLGYKDAYIEIPIDENTIHNFILSPTYTIYVDDDNIEGPWDGSQEFPYKIIQDAINDPSDGDTVFVYSGTYYENILIDKNIWLIGQDKDTTIIDGGSLGTTVGIYSDSVFFSNFTVKKSGHESSYTAGILIESNNIFLKNNNIFDNCIGIQITDAENCLIQGNRISNNYLPGIRLLDSTNNAIIGNTITTNGLDAIEYATVPGVTFESSFNNSLLDNEISNNAEGISFLRSHMNFVSNNFVMSNLKNGIYFEDSSNNSIQDNKVTGNYESGLKLNHSYNNSFYKNLIYDNGCEGIWLFFSYYNDFYENVVSGNKRGFELGGYKNKIWNNIIENNSEFGIHFWATCANKIYKNNFINNKDDASFSHIFLIGHSKINEFFWVNNNQFDQNYWGKSKLLPKLIFGYVKIFYDFENKELFRLSWLDIDWNPAKEAYDIQVPEV